MSKIRFLNYFFVALFAGSATISWAADAVASVSKKDQVLELWNSNQKKKAQSLLDKWMSEDKKSPQPWVVAAQFKFEQGKFGKCLSLAETALDKSPAAGDAYYWRARAFEAQKKPMEAANEMQAALLAQTTMPDAQEVWERIQKQLGTEGIASLRVLPPTSK